MEVKVNPKKIEKASELLRELKNAVSPAANEEIIRLLRIEAEKAAELKLDRLIEFLDEEKEKSDHCVKETLKRLENYFSTKN